MATAARPARIPRLLNAHVAEELQRLIEAGQLKPGERLNEATLAQRMGTSRGPIREAIRVLSGMGLVTPVPNRGVFVRQVSIQEMLDSYDLRALIFGYAVQRAAEHLTTARQRLLAALIEQMDNAAKLVRGARYYELNLRFHEAILEFAGNRRAARVYSDCVNELHLFRRPAFDFAPRMRRSNAEHRAILAAMQAGEGARARSIAEKHVLASRQRLLESLGDA